MLQQTDFNSIRVSPTLHWSEAFGTWLKYDHRKFGKRGSLNSKSIEAYLQDVHHFSKFYEQAYGQAFETAYLDEQVVRSYFEWMDMNRVCPSTFNRRLTTLDLMTQWLGCGDLTRCVARKDTEYEPRDKTPEEYESLETVAAEMSHLKRGTAKHGLLGQRDMITFHLMGLGGGLRVGSVAEMNVDDVSLSRGQVRVRGKGGLDRQIEVSEETINLLAAWIERMPKPVEDEQGAPLFVDWDGRRISTYQLRRRLKMIGAKAGVDVTCHDLRATMLCQYYATAVQKIGYAAADATRRVGGHKDFRTTQKHYLRASRTQIRVVMEAM